MKKQFAVEDPAVAGRAGMAANGSGVRIGDGVASRPRPSIDARHGAGFGQARLRPHPELVRQCQALQANVWLHYPEDKTKVTLFVGASAGCGASTVAAGFVGALAQDPAARILFIDFDLPKLPPGVDARPGIDLLRLLDSPDSPSRSPVSAPNVHALSTANFGQIPPSLFQTEAFGDFLNAARERFDYVVIDAPPLQHHPESLVLSRKADGVILVVESGRTRRQTALWARQQIEAARGNLLGVVLNRRKYYLPRWLYDRL